MKNFLTFLVGLIAYSNNVWLGASIYNLPKPNISFSDNIENLDRLYSFHGGYSLKLNKVDSYVILEHFQKSPWEFRVLGFHEKPEVTVKQT